MSCKIDYNIVSTGSKGNAVIINKLILIDCGVSFKALEPYYKDLKIVLLTHIHSDHFNPTTIKALARGRPTLRFACGKWLVAPLVKCGVEKCKIDIVEPYFKYNYKSFGFIPVYLAHNVLNMGYKIFFDDSKMIYCTDTNNLNGITAPDYDLYMIEADYQDEEIKERISQKKSEGKFCYEEQVIHNHLSKSKCDDFIYSNIGNKGVYVYMHCHEDK